jgi:ABC-type Fe3+-hydroxamate transport system substrate-binding protein
MLSSGGSGSGKSPGYTSISLTTQSESVPVVDTYNVAFKGDMVRRGLVCNLEALVASKPDLIITQAGECPPARYIRPKS